MKFLHFVADPGVGVPWEYQTPWYDIAIIALIGLVLAIVVIGVLYSWARSLVLKLRQGPER